MSDHAIVKTIKKYLDDIKPDSRYASFDYCYRYFHPKSKNDLTVDVEKSCLMLGFYLASWGMFRGPHLLSKSYKYYEPLINYVDNVSESIWDIDIDKYTPQNIDQLIHIYKEVREIICENKKTRHLVITTKVMLGVFGIMPAFDRYFTDTFRDAFKDEKEKSGFRSVNYKSLNCLATFYRKHQPVIDNLASRTQVLSYESDNIIHLTYPKAKVLDMYGFGTGYYGNN